MKYEKPELVQMGRAIEAIQGMTKPHGSSDIVDPKNPLPSVSAYEADE